MEDRHTPYISVVIPLYNKEKSIAITLQSVYEQTYKDYEVVIVNDGSADKSLDAVKDFVSRLENEEWRLKIVSQENAGVSAARNRGVKEAKGQYVAFLDADDIWEPTFLEEAVRLIKDFPGAAIYGLGLGEIYKGKRYLASEYVPTDFRGVVKNLWDDPNTMMAWSGSGTICPRELALKTPAKTQLTHGEDLDQWLRLMLQGDAVVYNKTLAYYILDAENRAMYKMPPIEKHIVSVISEYAEARANNPQFRKAFDTQMIYFLYRFMFTKDKAKAQDLAKLLDYSQLKWSLRLRMEYPRLYQWYERLKELRN